MAAPASTSGAARSSPKPGGFAAASQPIFYVCCILTAPLATSAGRLPGHAPRHACRRRPPRRPPHRHLCSATISSIAVDSLASCVPAQPPVIRKLKTTSAPASAAPVSSPEPSMPTAAKRQRGRVIKASARAESSANRISHARGNALFLARPPRRPNRPRPHRVPISAYAPAA
jgi:hypothetical protein